MKPKLFLLLVGMLLMQVGCALVEDWQVTYLRAAQGHAGQEDIKQRLGTPRLTKPLGGGGGLWVYRYWGYDAGDRNRPGLSWCEQYTLTFDGQTVLHNWVRQQYRPFEECASVSPKPV